jgi:hypothetical protein
MIKLEGVIFGHLTELNGKFKLRATEVTFGYASCYCSSWRCLAEQIAWRSSCGYSTQATMSLNPTLNRIGRRWPHDAMSASGA